jgi:F-type H+-transporting ATPase subunit b
MIDALLSVGGVLASEEPNKTILPGDINEVFWASSAFIIVMSLLVWKGGPAIKNAWNARIDRIRGELEGAEGSRREAETQLSRVQGRIADADRERERIRTEADETAANLVAQLDARTTADATAIRERAATDAESAKAQAEADLRAEIGTIALGAAETVVSRNLDPDTQRQLIENYIQTVGSN